MINRLCAWRDIPAKHRMIVNAVYLYASPTIMGLLGFVFWVIVARVISAEQVGLSVTAINIAAIMGGISFIGLNSLLIRFLPGESDKRPLFGTAVFIGAGTSLLVSIAALAFVKLTIFSQGTLAAMVLMLIIALLVNTSAMIDGFFVSTRNPKVVMFRNVAFAVGKIALIVLAFIWATHYGILAIWLLSLVIGLLLSLYFLHKNGVGSLVVSKDASRIIRDNWRFSFSNYIVHTLHHGCLLFMPVFVTYHLGAEQGAYFYMAWMIALQLYYASDSIAMSLFAEGSNNVGSFGAQFKKGVKVVALVTVIGVLLFIIFGRYFLLPFGIDYSQEGTAVLSVLALSAIPFGVIVLYKAWLRVKKANLELALVWVALIAISFSSGHYLAAGMGKMGIVYSWIGANCIVAMYIPIRYGKVIRSWIEKG